MENHAENESTRHPSQRCPEGDFRIQGEAGRVPRGFVDDLPDSPCSASHSEAHVDKQQPLDRQSEEIYSRISKVLQTCGGALRQQDLSGDTKR